MREPPKGHSSKHIRAVMILALLFAGVSVVVLGAQPEIRWRVEIVRLKAFGDLPNVEWFWLLKMLRPGSPFYLEELASSRNPYSVIRNPYMSVDDVRVGGHLFRSKCATCHGNAGHELANSLFDEFLTHGGSDWAIFRNIRDGIASTSMRAQEITEEEIWQVIAYLRNRENIRQNLDSTVQRDLLALRPVTFERLLNRSVDPNNWSTYSGTVDGGRFSSLDRLTKENVNQLKLAWVYQGSAHDYHVEATPIVVDGILITTEPPGSVVALHAESGQVLWRYSKTLPDDIRICCGSVNRGVAVRNSLVFFGTLDASLVALDIRSGEVKWEVKTADYSEGYSNTAAPLIVDGHVIVGVAGGEFGIRGFIDAYDIDTGVRAWRFETIPAPGEAGNETWPGDSWKTGGGPTWMTGSYDVDTNLIYWGVGNPGPNFTDEIRAGDNLYTNSIVALDAESGRLEWSFQFTPGDVHDYDANHVPIIAELLIAGRQRKVVMSATKNGFFYILDASSGEFLSAVEMTRQTWALGLDPNGRPIRNEEATPRTTGTRTYPSAAGGANWWPATYNPDLHIFTVPVIEGGAIFYSDDAIFRPGELYVGGSSERIPGEPRYKTLKAISTETNEILWERRGSDDRQLALTGGAMSTTTGLVFWGDSNIFSSLDALTGDVLWQANVGGSIVAAPMTYAVNDRQYVAISAGRGLFVFTL